MASCRAALWATAARPSTLASMSLVASTPTPTTAHQRRRARYQAARSRGPTLCHAGCNSICTAQAYQNVLSVLTFDPLGQQLPRWEVLVSDAQEGGRGGDQVPARRDHTLTAVHAGAPVASSGRQNSRPSAPLILFGGWHRLLKGHHSGCVPLATRAPEKQGSGPGLLYAPQRSGSAAQSLETARDAHRWDVPGPLSLRL